MTYEEAKIRLLNECNACGDYANEDRECLGDGDCFEYKHLLCEALNKQIEIEKAQFTHICKADRDIYPTAFSIYARVVSDNDESVTIDRFQKFGALPLREITISRKDFEKYYKPIESEK